MLHVGHFLVNYNKIFQFYIRTENRFNFIIAVGALESHFFIKHGTLLILSEQQAIDCSSNGAGCQKGLMNTVFEYSMQKGLTTGDNYPYKGAVNRDNSCNLFDSDRKIQSFVKIAKGSEIDLKDAVCRSGPVSVAIDASDKFRHYSYGVYRNENCKRDHPNHGVLVVGYGFDDASGLDYWLVKNSWGNTWGEKGYFRVARNHNNHCGIANMASYPVV